MLQDYFNKIYPYWLLKSNNDFTILISFMIDKKSYLQCFIYLVATVPLIWPYNSPYSGSEVNLNVFFSNVKTKLYFLVCKKCRKKKYASQRFTYGTYTWHRNLLLNENPHVLRMFIYCNIIGLHDRDIYQSEYYRISTGATRQQVLLDLLSWKCVIWIIILYINYVNTCITSIHNQIC